MDKRRIKCFIFSSISVILLLAIVLGLVFGLTQRQTSQTPLNQTFIQRCEKFEGRDCQNIWNKFTQAYVGRDPCQVSQEAYDPLIAAAPFTAACNKTMLWSKTKPLVHDLSKKRRDCFVTLEDTLLGFVLNDLTWCGKKGSNETFTTDCPAWDKCETNPVRSFWYRASAGFADVACGSVTAMLNGSINTPFNSTSIFGKIEVKRLNSDKVKSLNVVLVTQKNPGTNCTNPSLKDLQKELPPGITYSCKEATESQILKCGSDPHIPCEACW